MTPRAPPLRRLRPDELDGALCVCASGRETRAHQPSYLLSVPGRKPTPVCGNAAAAFAWQAGIPFPLTSAARAESP